VFGSRTHVIVVIATCRASSGNAPVLLKLYHDTEWSHTYAFTHEPADGTNNCAQRFGAESHHLALAETNPFD
jgi:hypothetical protein